MTLRFTVLVHDHPFLHWDLLLEQPGRELLKTWRLLTEPLGGTEVVAETLPDHRRKYLDYEGPIGGDRGTVAIWDHGSYEIHEETGGCWELSFHGEKLQERWRLERQPEPEDHWSFKLT